MKQTHLYISKRHQRATCTSSLLSACPHWQSSPHQPLFPSLSHLENQTRPVPPSPPSNPTLPYLPNPKSTHSLTTHSPLTNQPTTTNLPKQALPHCPTCAHHSFTPPSLPSRSPPSGGLPPNNQTHHHSQYPTSGFQHPKRKKSEAWRVVTGPQLLLHRRLHGAYADEPLTSTRLALPCLELARAIFSRCCSLGARDVC